MRSFHERKDFKTLLLAAPEVAKVLPPADLERAFDLDQHLRHVDHILERAFRGEKLDD